MKPQPEFFCYGPRPKHVGLEPLPHAIYVVLDEATAIFQRGGVSVRTVVALLAARGVEATHSRTHRELRKLKGLGLAEQLANAPDRWRVKR